MQERKLEKINKLSIHDVNQTAFLSEKERVRKWKKEFSELSQKTQPTFEDEQAKLVIMQDFLKLLAEKNYVEKEKEKKQEENKKWLTLRKIGFFSFFTIGVATNGLDDFIGFQALFSQLPALSDPVILGLTVAFTLLTAVLYCAFEGVLLKKLFGIKISENKKTTSLTQLYDPQIDALNTINDTLRNGASSCNIPAFEYEDYTGLAKLMNKDIKNKNATFKHELTFAQKAIIRGMTAFGVLLTIGAGIFSGNAFLGLVAASLIGTPAGWAIVGVLIVTSLVMFLSQRGQGIDTLISSDARKFKKTKNKFEKHEQLEEKYTQNFDSILANKQRTEKALKKRVYKKHDINAFKHTSRHHSTVKTKSSALSMFSTSKQRTEYKKDDTFKRTPHHHSVVKTKINKLSMFSTSRAPRPRAPLDPNKRFVYSNYSK